ncbi:MAG: hypothetical protein ACI3U1_02350 [Peptococcaceae bacterium]
MKNTRQSSGSGTALSGVFRKVMGLHRFTACGAYQKIHAEKIYDTV